MTYRELLYKAQRLVNQDKITLGEYDEMTKPLDEEVRKVVDFIKLDDIVSQCPNCKVKFSVASNENREIRYCPYCGVNKRGSENG